MTKNWRLPVRVLGAMGLAVALSGFTGCVSLDEYNKQGIALDEARRTIAQTEQDLARLRAQIDSLKNQLAAQQGLNGGFDALKAENALLQQKLKELQDKYNELVKIADGIKLPDNVNAALAKLAERYPDLLEYDPTTGRLRFKSDLTFDLGSTEVKPRAREALGKLAEILNDSEIAKNQIRIVGHTDTVPIRSSAGLNPNNWFLSTNRAHAIREVLQGDGVSDTRLQPAGDGPTQPIAENMPGIGQEKNRRVDIYILPTLVPENAINAPESDSHVIASGPRTGGTRVPKPVTKKPAKPTTVAPVAPAPIESTTPVVPVPSTRP